MSGSHVAKRWSQGARHWMCVCLFVCLCMRPMLCRFVSVRLNEDSSLAKIYFRFVQFPVQLLIFRVHMNQFGVTTNETHATQMRASTLICMAKRFPFPHPRLWYCLPHFLNFSCWVFTAQRWWHGENWSSLDLKLRKQSKLTSTHTCTRSHKYEHRSVNFEFTKRRTEDINNGEGDDGLVKCVRIGMNIDLVFPK